MPCIGRRALLAAALATPGLARAQAAWPERPIRLVVPFPPGGSNDVVARPLADRLQALIGQPVIVENRGGAGGAIGAGQVAQTPADGHTLMVTSSSFATTAVLQKTPWDAEGSFDAVALLARAPFFIMVNPAVPARTVAELVALARSKPGGLDYGSSGAGGINHFISEYFCQQAGIRMNHVPYRGTAPAVTDLVAGTIPLMITTVASANAAIRDGRVRVIAATAPGGGLPPEVPAVTTVKEQGIDYEVAIWWGLLAPRGLAPGLRLAIHRAVNAALGDANLARIYAAEGATPSPVGPEDFAAVLHADLARWRDLAARAGIRAE
ncbi:Bug family tripartite tricarboxylate transporter substrate binding protein [Belnapia rosea]|uniref:Tripartite-type tricarboxylate transporter, receptor component TctC n=1 Tax=Belnapia rosea TaxID=938405 RepID=A0A1G6PA94_9PROT|nr:tripartite tricarboxylate transporter substrate-binding protein [Belnapia rosea]SDB53899.1 Tripartite-type tricarboxylate transporter, receptor component TctC [Belnapia rosea]SDC76524.1 Tripartite-type tricarboxylate transporter, receptor component TctC [Belnapia rosea]